MNKIIKLLSSEQKKTTQTIGELKQQYERRVCQYEDNIRLMRHQHKQQEQLASRWREEYEHRVSIGDIN